MQEEEEFVKEHSAAVAIQTRRRGMQGRARRRELEEARRVKAAIAIQARCRGRLGRRREGVVRLPVAPGVADDHRQ